MRDRSPSTVSVRPRPAVLPTPDSGLSTQRSPLVRAWSRFSRSGTSVVGLVALLVIGGVALLGPLVATNLGLDPTRQEIAAQWRPPSLEHLLGTDEYGRDVFLRLIFAARINLTVGLIVAVISTLIGLGLGLLAGYYGGLVDDLVNALIQTVLNVPLLFLLIIIVVVLRPDPIRLAVIIGLLGWMGMARQVRAVVLSLRERDYVTAARCIGADDRRIIARHVLPNLSSLLLALVPLQLVSGMLTEAGLSYIGMGVQQPTPSWGNMLVGSMDALRRAPWLALAPGLSIFVTVLATLAVFDGLRDALDPHVAAARARG